VLFLFFLVDTLIFCTGEDGDIISLTLPPSQYIRTVTVTKGVQTPNHVRVTENPPAGPPVLVFLSRLSARGDMIAGNASPTNDIVNPGSKPSTQEVDDKVSNIPTLMAQRSVENVHTATTASLAVDIGMDTLTLGDPVGNQGTPTPSQHPPPSHLRECPTHERFNVSKEVQKLYPPLVLGWKNRSWVVVIRGCDIGIFYDFWCV